MWLAEVATPSSEIGRDDLTTLTAGVHTEPARLFRNSAFLTYRRQCDFRLELSAVLLPSMGHVLPPADRPF
jgi:hypothetical protein